MKPKETILNRFTNFNPKYAIFITYFNSYRCVHTVSCVVI